MPTIKAQEIQQSDILRLEAEMNNLWGEINTSNISHNTRGEIESELSLCEEKFRMALEGQTSFKELEMNLSECDKRLAFAAIQQAENEIPRSQHAASAFLALGAIRRELNEGHCTPIRARHEVKTVMRRHS